MSEENSFRYDVRVRENLLKKGLLTEEELQNHLSALPDVESEAEPLGLEQPASLPQGDAAR